MIRLKTLIQALAISLMLILSSGCVSHYSVSAQEVSQYLNKELKFDFHQGNNVLGATLKLNNVVVQLGEKPDVMGVTSNSTITINNPLLPLRVELTTQLEAKPWYDKHSHSIYLKDLQLVKISSNPKDLGQIASRLSPELMAYLRNFLESQPIYTLDEQKTNQALMAKVTEKVTVEPGKLVLVFK